MSRSPHHLRFEMVAALALKAALLTVLYYVCFSPSHQVKVDPQALGQHLLSDAPAPIAK